MIRVVEVINDRFMQPYVPPPYPYIAKRYPIEGATLMFLAPGQAMVLVPPPLNKEGFPVGSISNSWQEEGFRPIQGGVTLYND